MEPRGDEQCLKHPEADPEVRVIERRPSSEQTGRDDHRVERKPRYDEQPGSYQATERLLDEVRAKRGEPVERSARMMHFVEFPQRVHAVEQPMGEVVSRIERDEREWDRHRAWETQHSEARHAQPSERCDPRGRVRERQRRQGDPPRHQVNDIGREVGA
jgi:hypothetical protein